MNLSQVRKAAARFWAVLVTAALPLAASAETSTDAIVDTMQTVCASPGFTLEQRLAVLRDWQPADEGATRKLLQAISDGVLAEQRMRPDFDPGDADELAARYRDRLAKRLAEPVDAKRGAMRLLLSAADPNLALAIDASPGRFELLNCMALIRNPTDEQLRDLTLRFSLFPSQQSGDFQNWDLSSLSKTATAHTIHGRSLLLLKSGGKVGVATLKFTMTVRTR